MRRDSQPSHPVVFVTTSWLGIFDGCSDCGHTPTWGASSSRIAGRGELVFPPLPYIVVCQIEELAVEISLASFTVSKTAHADSRISSLLV